MKEHDPDSKWLREAFSAGQRSTGATGCPGDDRIWAAARGELPPDEIKTLLAHSLDCADCKQSWLAASALATEGGLADAGSSPGSHTDAPPAGHTERGETGKVIPFRRRRLMVSFGAIAASLLVAVLLTAFLTREESPAPLVPLAASIETSLWKVGDSAPLASGDRLRVGDRIYMSVAGEQPLYVYVINADQTGEPAVLFPVEGAQWSNPLPPDAVVRLPGDVSWAYDSWEVSSAGGQESFTVVAALEPLEELEGILGGLDAAVNPDTFTRGTDSSGQTPDLDPGESREALARALQELRQSATGTAIVREIVLENPGAPD